MQKKIYSWGQRARKRSIPKYVASQATSLPILSFTNPVEPTMSSLPSTRLPASPGNSFGSFTNVDTLEAEILWVLQTRRHHSSTSSEDVHLVFKVSVPDSQCASPFYCDRDKTAYLAGFGVAPYLRTELISRVKKDAFIIIFDESMNKTMTSKQPSPQLSGLSILGRSFRATQRQKTCWNILR